MSGVSKVLSTGAAVLAMSLSVIASAHADGRLQGALARKAHRRHGSTNPPWGFQDKGSKLIGFDVDLARIIAKGLFNDLSKVEFVT